MGKGKGNSALIGIGAGLIGLAVGAIAGFLGSEEKQKEKQKANNNQKREEITFEAMTESEGNMESLECVICYSQLKEPLMISICGHTFDKKCILDWLEKNNKCPLCQVRFTKNDLKQNFVVQDLLNEIRKSHKK